MKHLILFLIISNSCFCFSQIKNNSTLWEISGNGLNESSYLFGTLHAVPGKQFEISDSVQKYLNISGTLILEIDPDIPIGEQVKLAQRMFLPKGVTIENYIDSVQYELFYNYLKDSIKIKEGKINRYFTLKPAFMQTMILTEFIDKPKAYDIELKKLAGKKKNFIPLETIDEQMNLLDSIPFEQQLAFNSCNYKLDKEYFSLLNLYLKQDLQGINSLMFSDPEFENIENDLLTERNINWIPKINESIANESSFIAVGCAHLIGDEGLISLLIKEGYILQPIIFSYGD
ncbi:MAG: TraB/GumN family protein [Bacteroidales bacterium]|nr:TraB/GumN family protein [Bacteroidales bacterium]